VTRDATPSITALRQRIEAHWDGRAALSPDSCPADLAEALALTIGGLDRGELRVAEPVEGRWITHEWLKKAVLLFFRTTRNVVSEAGYTRFYDKLPLKYAGASELELQNAGVRIVPPAVVRRGAYVGPGAVLMPCYVNVGARIESGTMVDTWATVGSCAQIGRNVHLSGGVGIGGVLEPLQASPTIIEDDCFIGARSEVVEGVVIERGAVLGMGVFIGQSTRIYDRETRATHYGRVPAGSVVVAGTLPSGDGGCALYCAVIVKKVDARTRAKTSLNDLLRE
jgi:2,3,4,5-tetrahydropyridine-2-carboxylate N-succinyltransferase